MHKNDDIAQGAVEGVLLVGFRCQRRKMAARSTHMINWPPLTTSTTATMAMMMVMIVKVYPHDKASKNIFTEYLPPPFKDGYRKKIFGTLSKLANLKTTLIATHKHLDE